MRKYEERRRKKKVGERKKEEGRKKNKEERKQEENCWAGGCELVYKKTDREFWFGSAVLYDVYV